MPASEFIMLRYPHMSPTEAAIWTKFLTITDMQFLAIVYDLHLGPGYVPEWLKEPALIKMAKTLTQLRVDALAESDVAYWIFEVKPRAGRSALGQIDAYTYWFVKEYAPAKPVYKAVVCRFVDVNMVEVFRQRGVEVFLVE